MTEDELESIRERKRRELAESENGESTGRKNGESVDSSSAPDEPIHVESIEQFSDVTTKFDVVLVDFYADWCGPCKMLEPIVADVAAETSATVAKVDVDAHGALAQQYRVQGVPTLYLFVDGEPAERLVGVQEKAALVDLVESHA